jgi:23S rRNA pseudouridine2605 synthase
MKKTEPDIQTQSLERLHKFIARCGVCSRRKAEDLIQEGRVKVNDQRVSELGFKICPTDVVKVDNAVITEPKLYYLVMNKPIGVVTTLDDPKKRPTVVKFLPDFGVPIKPIGRLDMDTEGLLMFTNDGELAMRLSHPRYSVGKTYIALVQGEVSQKALGSLQKGIYLDGRRTRPAEVKILHVEKSGKSTRLEITIHEGRYRQVRRMCETVGHPVESLRRVKIGPIVLKDLAPGMCRLLGQKEVEKLKRLTGLI